jgi:hypothetical protein
LMPSLVQNSGLKRFHCSSLTRPGRDNCHHGFDKQMFGGE